MRDDAQCCTSKLISDGRHIEGTFGQTSRLSEEPGPSRVDQRSSIQQLKTSRETTKGEKEKSRLSLVLEQLIAGDSEAYKRKVQNTQPSPRGWTDCEDHV